MNAQESRLVFSTDPKLSQINTEFFNELISTEARQDMRETIQEINKSRRRIAMRNVKGLQLRSQEQSRQKDEKIEKVINYLAGGKRTYAEIYKHLFPNDKERMEANITYVRNLMNQIRIASDSIIFPKDGFWVIDPKYISQLSVLIQTTKNNKSKIWKKYDKKKLERQTTSEKRKPIKFEKKSEKQSTSVSNISNMVICGNQEAITVPVKIALTIQVKIEVIQ